MRKKIVSLFFVLFLSSIGGYMSRGNASEVATQKSEFIHRFSLSLDNRCDQIKKYQDDKGSKNICEINPIFGLHYTQSFNEKLKFTAKIDLSWPLSADDDSYTKLTASLLAGINYYPHEFPLYYNAMLGFAFTHLRGSGGTQILNNGNTTEEFYNPTLSRTASNLILNLGFGYNVTPFFTPQLYTQVYNLENSDKRSFNIGFGIIYHLGKKL